LPDAGPSETERDMAVLAAIFAQINETPSPPEKSAPVSSWKAVGRERGLQSLSATRSLSPVKVLTSPLSERKEETKQPSKTVHTRWMWSLQTMECIGLLQINVPLKWSLLRTKMDT